MIPVWFLISFMSFFLLHLSPANPALLLLGGTEVDKSQIARITHQLGLDRPLPVQYGLWLTNLFKGDWGYSYFLHGPVLTVILQRAAVSVGIAGLGLVIALLLGLVAGIVGAANRGSLLDLITGVGSTLGLSVPEFWFAIVLILVFALRFPIFPVAGFEPPSASIPGWFMHILLPSFTIGFIQSAIIARIVRSSLLDTMQQEYLRTARAKGLSRTAVLLKHGLRSSLLPVLTIIGIVTMGLLAGDFVVEIVFAIPGLGQLLLNATIDHDYPLVQGGILFVGTIVMLVNLIVDICYSLADPRVHYG
jgi:peptide/nickel transport system permease protein